MLKEQITVNSILNNLSDLFKEVQNSFAIKRGITSAMLYPAVVWLYLYILTIPNSQLIIIRLESLFTDSENSLSVYFLKFRS